MYEKLIRSKETNVIYLSKVHSFLYVNTRYNNSQIISVYVIYLIQNEHPIFFFYLIETHRNSYYCYYYYCFSIHVITTAAEQF